MEHVEWPAKRQLAAPGDDSVQVSVYPNDTLVAVGSENWRQMGALTGGGAEKPTIVCVPDFVPAPPTLLLLPVTR